MSHPRIGRRRYLDFEADGALLLLRVDVELDGVLLHVLDDLHQAAEHLGLQLADEAADGGGARVGRGALGGRGFGQQRRRELPPVRLRLRGGSGPVLPGGPPVDPLLFNGAEPR